MRVVKKKDLLRCWDADIGPSGMTETWICLRHSEDKIILKMHDPRNF